MSKVVRPKILLVDDIATNLTAMEGLLQDLEVEIHTATSGNQALGLMLEHDFALVLLDVQMPKMDGFEVCNTMRLAEKTRHMPVIFVTANSGDVVDQARGYTCGAVDFIFKPINDFILRSKVGIFLDLYRLRLEVKTLRGHIAICSRCKKIRDGDRWRSIEAYIEQHSEALFSHAVCYECEEAMYGGEEWFKKLQRKRALADPQKNPDEDE